jgi:hypothetical protein
VPTGTVHWITKPAATRYADLRATLSGTTWQRQLVLGPAPEFCRVGEVPSGATLAATTTSEPVYPATHSSRPLMP